MDTATGTEMKSHAIRDYKKRPEEFMLICTGKLIRSVSFFVVTIFSHRIWRSSS
jgi:hypothetical protein